MKLIFRITPTQRLIITAEARQKMEAFAQRHWYQSEAGGVLMGRFLLDSEDVVVDEVTTPQGQDRRSRVSFFRSKKHSGLARARWSIEESTSAYLGLWHTHPEPDPTPSFTDRRDWESAVARDTFDGDGLFFPIVGTERLRVWTKSRTSDICELNSEAENEDNKN